MKEDRNRSYDPLRSKARIAITTAVAVVAGLGVASGLGWTHTVGPNIDTEPRVEAAAVQPAMDLSDAFVNIAEEVTPAVVRIEVERPGRQIAQRGLDLRDFFDPDGQPRNDDSQQAPPQIGGGTGFIVSSDGYIMTNDHVVSEATRVSVHLNNGLEYPARVVGADPYTDVAVVKIDADGSLPTLSFGDSDAVRVGEWVLAVGNPGFGQGPANQLDYTVTAGIISARSRGLNLLSRELQRDPRTAANAQYAIEDFLQTDAVINPGNSGGPMVDLRGQVIGINSAIASATGFYQGYGFAIPVNLAQRVMEDLVEYGYVKRPILGVTIAAVAPEDAEAYGLPEVAGALVQGVTAGGPAEAAGLHMEDVIVAVEGQPVELPNELQQRVAQYRPGEEVEVTVFRSGERRTFDIRLGEADLNQTTEPRVVSAPVAEQRLGIAVRDLTPELAEELGFDSAEGVVISDVERASAAGRRGLPVGVRIVEINDRPVTSADDVRDILTEVQAGDVVNFIVESRAGNRTVINIRMPRD